MDLRPNLLMHAPPQVQSDWALINNVRPAHEWPENGPPVGLGLEMLQGKTAVEVRGLIAKFTNPELLDEIARTDNRVKVAAALIENGNMSLDGYKAVLDRHGHHEWVRRAFFNSKTMPLRLHEVEELGIPAPRMGIENDARAVGLKAAFEIAADYRADVVHDLMDTYVGDPKAYTPRASHAEIIDLFEHYYQSEFARRMGGPVMPEGTERWIVEVPGAYERILHALTNCEFDVANSRFSMYLSHMPEDVQGDVPDVRPLLESGSRDSSILAHEILGTWFEKRPASPAELEKFKDVVDVADFRPRLRVTPETLLAASQPMRDRLCVVKPFRAAWDALNDDVRVPNVWERVRNATTLLVNSDAQEVLENLNRFSGSSLRGRSNYLGDSSASDVSLVQEISDKYAELLDPIQEDTSTVLNRLASKHHLWGRMLQRESFWNLVVETFTTNLVRGDGSVVHANWLLTPEIDDTVRAKIMSAVKTGDLSDGCWKQSAQYLISSVNTPSEVLADLEASDPERYLRLLLRPVMQSPQDESWARRRSIDMMAEQYMSVAVDAAVASYEQGDNSKIDALFSVLQAKDNPLREYHLTRKIILTERGLLSGMCTARQAISYSECYETIAKILTDRFGDDPIRWQLAVELLEEWEDTIPSLLEVVDATG